MSESEDLTQKGTARVRTLCSSHKPYTQEEDDFLKRVYSDLNYTIEEIAASMDNRSAASVAKRAGVLKLSRAKSPNTIRANEGYRVCTYCKEEMPFSEFTKNKSKPYGIESICKSCNKVRRRVKREEKKKQELMQKFIEKNPTRICTRCNHEFETSEENFAWMISSSKFDANCRKCSAERTKEYMEKNLKEKGYRK